MELIEEILAKQHRSPTSLSNHPNIRVRKYLNVPNEFFLPQKQTYAKSSWLTTVHSPKNQNALQTTFSDFRVSPKTNEGYVKRNVKNIHQYLNQDAREFQTKNHKRQFTITLYPNENKATNLSMENRTRTLDKITQKQPFQLQVNRFPIMRKKQSKRKQLVKSLKKQQQRTPQLELLLKRNMNSPSMLEKRPPAPIEHWEKVQTGRKKEKVQICGWQDGDSFQD